MILDMPQYNLRVRCRENQDKERLAVLANNKKIQQRMIDSFPHPYTVQDAAGWITTNKGKKSTHFAIVDAENMVIGAIGYDRVDRLAEKHIMKCGYWLGEAYRNQGKMTVLMHAFVRYLFSEHTDLERLEARVFEGNSASMKILEKTGFQKEGITRKGIYKDGVYLNDYVYSLLRSDLSL